MNPSSRRDDMRNYEHPNSDAQAGHGLLREAKLHDAFFGSGLNVAGERTPLACNQRRRAVGLVYPIHFSERVEQKCETQFAARRGKQHAGGVFSP